MRWQIHALKTLFWKEVTIIKKAVPKLNSSRTFLKPQSWLPITSRPKQLSNRQNTFIKLVQLSFQATKQQFLWARVFLFKHPEKKIKEGNSSYFLRVYLIFQKCLNS